MGHHRKKPNKPQESASSKEKLKAIKKARKQKLKEKRARLVIHNLPFQVTEENLKEHFEKFGEIDEIKILKKEDGKLVGCAFIQFKLVQKAAKARHHTNGKPFLGRDIQVDFAMAKEKYEANPNKDKEIKEEDKVEIKEEPVDVEEMELTLDNIKTESDTEVDKQENLDDNKEIKDQDDSEEESDDEKIQEEESDDEEIQEEEEHIESQNPKRPKIESNDVSEGKTIFIKNVPFTATNEDLKQCMRQFGPIYYALVCIDRYTEHSKGTAFVKFQRQEDAEKALAAGTELTLLGNILDCHRALSRNEVQQKNAVKQEEKTAPKDTRNLYLVKEGVILAGTKAAEGVSATDMAKRLQLEQYKTQMLRNLNMFVSRERLVIHNVPPNWDDKKLRILFNKYSPKGATIKETRIMRDMKNVDANGVGRSKEFGFVAFTKHEDALSALRALNNNPTIFTAQRRPIVAFSIENKSMIKAKQKRLERSRLKNPQCKDFDPNVKRTDEENKKNVKKIEENSTKPFAGVVAIPGVQKMRNRHNLKTQAKLHHDNLKKEKKKQKLTKKSFKEKQQDFTKQPKQKINKKRKENDNFAKLVTDYKKMLQTPAAKKTKWYEEG